MTETVEAMAEIMTLPKGWTITEKDGLTFKAEHPDYRPIFVSPSWEAGEGLVWWVHSEGWSSKKGSASYEMTMTRASNWKPEPR